VPWAIGSSSRRTVARDETPALQRAVSIFASRLGSADCLERINKPQEEPAESSGSGYIPEYFTETSGKRDTRRYPTLKARAIASVMSNARVLEMSFMNNFKVSEKFTSLEKNE
jgi:hypothetical protein